MFKRVVLGIALILAGLIVGEAQITVPHTFIASVPVSQLNTNLSTLGTGALNRSGGTITGNITVDPGVTLDGVDVGASLGTSGDLDVDSLNLRNTGATALNVAGGINAGSGNVGIVDTTGKIPAISSLYFASLNGANLTGINATGLTTTNSNVTFSAGNFTADAPMTWTVASGDVNHNLYKDVGTMMFWSFAVSSTDTNASSTARLKVTLPASRTVAVTTNGVCAGSFTTTALNPLWVAEAGNTYVTIFRDDLATTWPASNTTISIRCNPVIFF